MNTKTIKVCVNRCDKCGFERFGFAPGKGNCPRCASPFSTDRWIGNPHVDTIAQAVREGGKAELRILVTAAGHDFRNDVVLRNQAVQQSGANKQQADRFFSEVRGGATPEYAAAVALMLT